MSNLNTYINYFRSLAVQHKDIKHNPASETGDAPVESCHFCKWGAEEIIAGLRTKISFSPAALLIELYETELGGSQSYDIKQEPKGAFTVLCKALPNDTRDEERAYILAEDITYQVLQKIWQDLFGETVESCAAPFRRFCFDKIVITPVGPLWNSCFGFRVEFDFEFHQQINISKPPAAGIFV